MHENPTILWLKHEQIDKVKWDATIAKAANGLIYATSIYLDEMSPHWEALVYGNYEAIFPITWRSKMGIRYVCQPAFSQQLGLFYINESYDKMLPHFLKKITLEYKLIEIFLNYTNQNMKGLQQAINLILPLNENYETIKASYKTDLLKNLKRTEKFKFRYTISQEATLAIQTFQQYYQQRMGARPEDYTHFLNCIQKLMQQQMAFVRSVTLASGELLAIGVFAVDNKRIYNLASTTLPNGRMMEANHFLFDELIKEYSGTGLILDFEGSDQPGIARFYQKFGSVPQPYFFWKINRLPAILRWWKR